MSQRMTERSVPLPSRISAETYDGTKHRYCHKGDYTGTCSGEKTRVVMVTRPAPVGGGDINISWITAFWSLSY
jgi:hypothetical protein